MNLTNICINEKPGEVVSLLNEYARKDGKDVWYMKNNSVCIKNITPRKNSATTLLQIGYREKIFMPQIISYASLEHFLSTF